MLKPPVLLFAASMLLAESDAHVTESERAKALQLLKESGTEFLKSVEALSDAQWNYKASPEKWSIAQTAEHIMLSEARIFSAVTGSLQSPADAEWEAKTADKAAMLERALVDRSHKATAPEPLQPQSNLTREQIVTRFTAARDKTIAFAQSTDLPLKEHLLPNPFFGPLNSYDWLIYVPLHNMRHNLQIAEIKASPDTQSCNGNFRE